ncbi:MAG TPA: type III secretion system cytoplasmic ring protein SctQ, partial [Polyangiaceae bacterium LLY-WYZ-15_(1-7)]|nr:type III secretion system cytoplasmic ring protein SctQ [Polyangiaceae bacterium LLY-WYZ-15_(1-7)]
LVGARRTTWWCARDAAGWRVERIERSWAEAAPARGDEAMSDEDTEGTDPGRDAPATLTDLGDAPVEVAVELGRLRLSLAQLTALRPGELLSTGVPIGERVRLRAGDTILGEGELVDVEGEVGVRILHLAGS